MDCLRKNHDSTLRLVQLSDLIPIKPQTQRAEEFFLIVPRPPFDGLSLVASRIVDSADLSDDQIDRATFKAKGLQGSAVLSDRLSLVLDFDAIAEMLNAGGDETSVFAQGHFMLTANSQQPAQNHMTQLPTNKEQPALTQ
jgi:chemotaxis protein histidine kinase CheA